MSWWYQKVTEFSTKYSSPALYPLSKSNSIVHPHPTNHTCNRSHGNKSNKAWEDAHQLHSIKQSTTLLPLQHGICTTTLIPAFTKFNINMAKEHHFTFTLFLPAVSVDDLFTLIRHSNNWLHKPHKWIKLHRTRKSDLNCTPLIGQPLNQVNPIKLYQTINLNWN